MHNNISISHNLLGVSNGISCDSSYSIITVKKEQICLETGGFLIELNKTVLEGMVSLVFVMLEF